ncbi:cation transporter [Rhodococcus sp. IEGM 1379]|uniref:cation transporter n=1 Tax=Rhodococcus sp. IEGM 1379 TaxID=3047086 RepID=UPI0024B7D7D2|nr:cation transporter [Rhodococcus sp. IEGM 1379]MDI9915953.1 cation transporter [Rhodococcus sp. IEGM 1379]
MERERKALQYSLVVATALAVMAAVWVWISQSQVILFDGVYALIGMVLTWMSLRVSRIADSGPTARFPFDKEALIPVMIAVQGMALLATLVYAAVEAALVILAGGADVTAGSLAAYGAISAVVSVMIWRYVGKVDRTSDLLVAETRQSGASAAFSALVTAGTVVAMILGRTNLSDAARDVDSVLVLLEGAPSQQVQALVHDTIAAIHDKFGLHEPAPTMSKLGRKLYIEAMFIVAPHTWEIHGEDAVRRSLAKHLADRPYKPSLNIGLTTDPALML